jgi:Fungal specific transcription factor domain
MEGGLGQPTKRRRATSPATVFKMLSGAIGSGSWSGEFDWETDPYEAYPELVDHLMDLYFKHINSTIYCMFPRKAFRKWLKSGDKSPDDRMLIYTMLTLASRFSTDPDRKTLSKNLKTTAQYALEHRNTKFSLQLVQSRIAYSLYCFAANNSNEAYEYCGAGIRAALAMRLNIDDGAGDLPDDGTFEYGLNRHAIAECRRRTFWSVYLMDVSQYFERYSTF